VPVGGAHKSAFEMMQQEEALGPNLRQIRTAIILVMLEDAKAISSQSHPSVVVGLAKVVDGLGVDTAAYLESVRALDVSAIADPPEVA